jgi:hypothetical protein
VDSIKLYREMDVYILLFLTSVLAEWSKVLHAAVAILRGSPTVLTECDTWGIPEDIRNTCAYRESKHESLNLQPIPTT